MSPELPRHSVSVAAAIVNDDGQFLAIRRRDNGKWEPPGGVLELHEGIYDGLIREVLEETGLRVQPVALTGIYKNLRRGIVALVFRCSVAAGATQTTTEAEQVQWLTAEDVQAGMDQAYAVRLLDSINDGPPAIRSHDGTHLM